VILLVRHGRTALNAQGRLQGRLDEPLDDEGERQATAIGRALGPVDRVVTSPLVRARQTAAHIDGPAEVDERWIELDYGTLDGMATKDLDPEVWRRWRSDLHFVPAGGESIAALYERVRAALDDLVADASARTIAVVTHVSPIKAAVAWALRAPPGLAWHTHLDQASITRITIGAAGAVLHGFNDVCHLT
jgi:broad specificity phosphatase PhoE